MQPAFTPAPIPDTVQVTVPPGSRLEALLCQRADALAAAEAAHEHAGMIVRAIKHELTAAYGDGEHIPKRFRIPGSAGWPPLIQRWVPTMNVDTKRLKQEDPVTWARFARPGGYWDLRKDDRSGSS